VNVWVHYESYAGRGRLAAVLIKRNAKRSRVRYIESGGPLNLGAKIGTERLVPNYAITERRAP